MAWEPHVIVAAVDGSDRSIEAARLAAEMARRNGSKLHILTVVRPPEGWWGIGGAPPPARALSESLVEAQKEVLDRTIVEVNLDGIDYQMSEELGDPAGAIVHYCDDVDADLLVIGRRGAGLIERFVMGSVADRLVHYSNCPVVVVPQVPFEFDRDTVVTPLRDRVWSADISTGWNIGSIPNGGYITAVTLAAVGRELHHPDPLTVTSHYLGRVSSGAPATIEVEVLRHGRTLSTASARLLQDGRERLRMLATYGDLDASKGPTFVTASPPPMPPPDECIRNEGGFAALELHNRVDARIEPSVAGGAIGEPVGRPEIGGWIRFADGRPPDLHSLALFVDAFPPTVLNLDRFGWVPTIELTIHFRAKPAPGWLRAWFISRFLVQSHVEEDGEVWDSEGNLVALSRQLARILPRS